MAIFTQERTERLYRGMLRINTQRHIHSIRSAFTAIMPLMVVGAFATAIVNLPLPVYQSAMENLFGTSWMLLGQLASDGTTFIVSILVLFSICVHLSAWYNEAKRIHVRENICAMVGLSCFVIICVPLEEPTGLPFTMTSVTGLFVAMVVAIAASELFIRLSMRSKYIYVVGEDTSFAVPQSFHAVKPAAVTVVAFVVIRIIMYGSGYSAGLHELLYDILRYPFRNLGSTAGAGGLFNLVTHGLWLFGIHGNNVLDDVAQNVFASAMDANIVMTAAGMDAPNLVTKTFFDSFVYLGGSGATLGLLVALLLFGRNRSYRLLYRYALPTGIFNINEPMIFGLPIVLNPIYAIPFVLTPMVLFFSSYFAMWAGLVPYTMAEVTWSTPILISGYLSTGSVAGSVLQVVNLGIAAGVYAPFVLLNRRLLDMRFKASYGKLQSFVLDGGGPGHKLLARMDDMGSVARRLAGQLKAAMKTSSMYMVYQPVVDAHRDEVYSVEALLRWKHPEHGFINPVVIIALAAEAGLQDELGYWTLEQAIRQRVVWNKQGLHPFRVSVNVVPEQLLDPRFNLYVKEILKRNGLSPKLLQIEITESAALIDNDATAQNLAALTGSGVTIAMDDFGVGHSSLSYLRTHPINTIKIDASLSKDVALNPVSRGIVITIASLCTQLDKKVIVEHVDNEQQLQVLLDAGTYLIQGYYFSKPLPGDEIPGYVGLLAKQLGA